jgi:ADP-ribose pyrophosphatase
MEFVRHPGGAAVVALNERNDVCLLRHYRAAVEDWLWELPAGKIDHGEPPLQTAQRELQEEAGCRAQQWDALGRIASSPGVFTEWVSLYLARGLTQAPHHPDADEVFELVWMPFADAVQQAGDGVISDAKTIAGLFRADLLLRRET